jgi:hypothetical protein
MSPGVSSFDVFPTETVHVCSFTHSFFIERSLRDYEGRANYEFYHSIVNSSFFVRPRHLPQTLFSDVLICNSFRAETQVSDSYNPSDKLCSCS